MGKEVEKPSKDIFQQVREGGRGRKILAKETYKLKTSVEV